MHGADVGAGGAAVPAAGRAGGRRAAGGGRRRLWEERLSSGAVFGLGMKFRRSCCTLAHRQKVRASRRALDCVKYKYEVSSSSLLSKL